MNQLFISALTIEKVRHLEDIRIPLSKDRMKHLIFTGRNGSGKTSVLDAMAGLSSLMKLRPTSIWNCRRGFWIY